MQASLASRSIGASKKAVCSSVAAEQQCGPSNLPSCAPRAKPFVPASSRQLMACRSQAAAGDKNVSVSVAVDRRQALGMLGAVVLSGATAADSLTAPPALAFTPAPPGFRTLVDRIDGYSFVYPERWLAVTVTGNDCFFRNPTNVDECAFVDISSPSSSQYVTVTDLGTPEMTAKQILEQYLNKEFMSTRLGIKREGSVLSASSREGADGRVYYDIAIRMTSYASRNPYVATQGEVLSQYGLEWDRVLFTTLGVANKRLYELRLQTSQATLDTSLPTLTAIANSFILKEVEA